MWDPFDEKSDEGDTNTSADPAGSPTDSVATPSDTVDPLAESDSSADTSPSVSAPFTTRPSPAPLSATPPLPASEDRTPSFSASEDRTPALPASEDRTPWRADDSLNPAPTPTPSAPTPPPPYLAPPAPSPQFRVTPPASSALTPPSIAEPAPPTRSFSSTNPGPGPIPRASEDHRSVRMWPLVLLAFLTVLASGAVSWFVADQTTDDTTTTVAAVTDIEGTQVPAVANTITPESVQASSSILADEPFAAAAALIEPSVVQLTHNGGLGSGVIIDANGTILTAAHVVGDNDEVDVRLYDGTVLSGQVLGADETTDVAVVTIDPAGRSLVAAPIANADDVRVGQLAVAVGSPFGFEQTVTAGIISGVDRVVNTVSMVQTDAPINPGNSGGPLIDLQGRVVGINDLIFTQSGTSAGVGFAISIDLAKLVADQLIAGEEVRLALLGVETGPDPDGRAGALINNVVPDSAADDAGLQQGDLLVAIDGRPTTGGGQLRAQVVNTAPGTTITLDVIRQGDRIQVRATLGST